MAKPGARVLNMHVNEKLLARVDKYRFRRMHASRTEAIEALLEKGLRADRRPENEVAQSVLSLSRRWREDTRLASSVTAIAMHPAYQEMIGLGAEALPHIFGELAAESDNPGQWFWALRAITGADPVPADKKGMVREMAKAWLAWAAENGYR